MNNAKTKFKELEKAKKELPAVEAKLTPKLN